MALIAAHVNAGVILVVGWLVEGCFTSTEITRLIRDGEKGGWGDEDYVPIATLSPPE